MKKFAALAAAGLFMAGFAGKASAEEGGKKFFGQAEYWSTDDAFKADKQEADDLINDPFTPYVENSSKVTAGFGVRFGMLFPAGAEGLSWGPSLGYVKGPKLDLTIDDGAPITEQIKENMTTDFIRLMLELKKDIKTSEHTALRLGAALGVAQGHAKEDFSTIGTFADPGSASKSWTGVSWEVSPSLIIKAGAVDWELGVMYSGFPTLKEDDDFNEFKWMPFGVKVGLNF